VRASVATPARASERIAIQQQLLAGVVPQARRVVGVLVTAGDGEDALPQHVEQCVLHAIGGAPLGERAGHGAGQAQSLIRGAEQHRAGVAAAVGLIEPKPQEVAGTRHRTEPGRLC
jgi:hypothetical protein